MIHRRQAFQFILIMAGLAALASGCAGESVYVAPDSVTQYDDSYSDTDLKIMAEQMTRSLIQTPKIAGAQKPFVVAILDIQNKTSQHINTESITDKLMMAMLKTGRMRFVDRKLLKDTAKELALSSSGAIDPAQAKRLGKMTAADLLLGGEISSINKVNARTSMTYYRLSLHIVDLETNEIIWADETEIKKIAKKGFEDW
jgi:penicillin-binding protein activator